MSLIGLKPAKFIALNQFSRALPAGQRDGRSLAGLATFDLLATFSFMWGAATLYHLFNPKFIVLLLEFNVGSLAALALCLMAIAVVLRPRSVDLLFYLAVAQIVEYSLAMPVGSNHYIMMFFVNVAICASYIIFKLQVGDVAPFRKEFFTSWSAVGRYCLVIMYFFGVFHKINTDWFDPAVSCAVALTDTLVGPWGLKSAWLDQFVIYGTLVVEGIAMVCLCIPRLKYVGFLVGMPLHMIIGVTPYAWYPNYSSLVFALYALFLPEDFIQRIGDILKRNRISRDVWHALSNRNVTLLAVATVLFALSVVLLLIVNSGQTRAELRSHGFGDLAHTVLMGLWAVYSVIIYVAVVVGLWGKKFTASREDWLPRPRLILVIPALFLLNGFAPYIGLKTEAAISMFSNLHTEGAVTNHLILNPPPYIFDYQDRTVKILSSSDRYFQNLANLDLQLVEFAFWKQVQKNPNLSVTYQIGDEVRHLERAGDALPGHEQPVVLQKLLPFKPVDFNRPKVCSH